MKKKFQKNKMVQINGKIELIVNNPPYLTSLQAIFEQRKVGLLIRVSLVRAQVGEPI